MHLENQGLTTYYLAFKTRDFKPDNYEDFGHFKMSTFVPGNRRNETWAIFVALGSPNVTGGYLTADFRDDFNGPIHLSNETGWFQKEDFNGDRLSLIKNGFRLKSDDFYLRVDPNGYIYSDAENATDGTIFKLS